MGSVSRVETLIGEKREIDHVTLPFRFSWIESGDYTQFLLRWQLRPALPLLTQVIVDELRRRQGLRAYGVKGVGARRRSKVNQIGAVARLQPRALEEVAKPSAA